MTANATRTMAPPEKLVPWNSTMWNPVDSVEVVLMLPEPTTGVGGGAGLLLLEPILVSLHLRFGEENLKLFPIWSEWCWHWTRRYFS